MAELNGAFSDSGDESQTSFPPYVPVTHHWFYKQEIDEKLVWEPFSKLDSQCLEEAFTADAPEIVATDGGRFDVNVRERTRTAVYWNCPITEVRRCSWFYKGTFDGRYIPYSEEIAEKLECEYRYAYETNKWRHKVEFPNGENVIFHGPEILVHFAMAQTPDIWGSTPQTGTRPRVVKRGFDEFEIEEGETKEIDHLLFMVHGVGSKCDLKFRSLVEVVNDFRSMCRQLVQSHYATSCEKDIAHRIEILPIHWHDKLHSEETGIDRKLKNITLESIPRLRDFTNDTVLDILFYTSPIYCQTIISRVGSEMNRIYDLFKKRNPSFKGGVSVAGHSLGSLIIFDLLCHQRPSDEDIDEDDANINDDNSLETCDGKNFKKPHPLNRRMSKRISYMLSTRGTGQPQITYPHLNFYPTAFFALGSPIGMFVTIRGLDTLGENFMLPTCPSFFNIFHPYDPVAYRIESLVNPDAVVLRPYLIPHHKGRKRMHLELKETMVRVGADLKQKFFDSLRSTWNSFYQFAMNNPNQNDFSGNISPTESPKVAEHRPLRRTVGVISETEEIEENISLGQLNRGRRIDYVLQEAPVEFINEYLFALQSHVCYWESEDTMLIILKEIYDSMGIQTDSQIPQQTMTIRPND